MKSSPVKYDEKSRCPDCRHELSLNLVKKGLRIRCKNCGFITYPRPNEISGHLLKRFYEEGVQPQLDSLQSRLDKQASSPRHGGSRGLKGSSEA